MGMTRFEPSRHGFAFENTFLDWAFGSLGFLGRCGGMTYAALDYFLANRPIPRDPRLPDDGSVLSTYIWERNFTSIWSDTGDDFSGRLFGNWFGWETNNIFRSGLTQEFPELVRRIDAGNPVPVGLVIASGSPFDFGKCHQVLAIGYDRLSDSDVRVKVYDPNHANTICELAPNAAQARWVEHGTDKVWLTWFVNRDYDRETPPADLSDIVGKDWRNRDMSGKALYYGDYRKAHFENARFLGADVHMADLSDSVCSQADFTGANLYRANLTRARCQKATFHGADLREAVLHAAELSGLNLVGARMGLAKADMVNLVDADLTGADLSRAELSGSQADRAKFIGANLGYANLTRASLVKVDAHGATFGPAQLVGANLENADLSGANLNGANLTGARLNGALLHGTDLGNATLIGTSLREADLHGADLRNVKAMNADFTGSNRQGTDLRGAILTGAHGI